MQKFILLFYIVLQINSSLCQTGFIQVTAIACSNQVGPCATIGTDVALSLFPKRCLTCFDDAFLWPQSSITACVPYVCDQISPLGSGSGCTHCQEGYSLTPNRSCILNSISSQPTSSEKNVTVSNNFDLIGPSLIISATAIIVLIVWAVFKCKQRKQSKIQTIHPQTVLKQTKDPIRRRKVNNNDSISQLVLGQSSHTTELN